MLIFNLFFSSQLINFKLLVPCTFNNAHCHFVGSDLAINTTNLLLQNFHKDTKLYFPCPMLRSLKQVS